MPRDWGYGINLNIFSQGDLCDELVSTFLRTILPEWNNEMERNFQINLPTPLLYLRRSEDDIIIVANVFMSMKK